MNEKKIGFSTCIKALGTTFYEQNKNRSVFAAGEEANKGLWCFVGINTKDSKYNGLCLKAGFNEWEYYASCYVKNNAVTMDKCKLPDHDEY